MKKQIFLWPALIALLLPLFLAACGDITLPSQISQVPSATGNELYVLDNGFAGTQHIVALPVGTSHPTARLTLPAGLTDLKHQRVYLASPRTSGDAQTTISVFDTQSGASVRAFTIPGSYVTAAQEDANAMLSGNGRWLALREQHAPAGITSIALVDTQSGKLVKSIHLVGDFTLDAVSPRGTVLYLLEYYQAGTSHYNVRAYDVQASQLLEGNIADKTDLGEKMQGGFLTRKMSGDSDMAYTLYINPETNKAFIHILWLPDSIAGTPFPMLARCIDLPVGNFATLLHYYTLTLSHDGKTLYAVNAALGTVATINLDAGVSSYQLWLIPNAKSTHFTPDQSALTAPDQTRNLYDASVLSPDQNRLYVAGPRGIWVLNTSKLKAQGQYLKQQSFTGLAISSDGKTLYAVSPTTGVTLLDPNTGQVLNVVQGSVQAPWGIEWITD
jgi:WD40 repeat protein